ncbi:MAG: hypothetical protein M1818_006391 [Claussenomyces sp. TS43310]|nr:MAG: hypothetical protein M1818_006391 [Claussenomyces sp. TS43310]
MASTNLHPPAHLPPAIALQLSQQAPTILQNAPSSISSYSLHSLFAAPESADLWITYENLILSCLRTGDEQSARLCLERLMSRFGSANERLRALQGLFQEATAENDTALQRVLDEYDKVLTEDAGNMPVSKRRIALLKSMGKSVEAIQSLNRLLDICPTDAEAWSELAELYIAQGMYQQGIFALEEVLLITPYAWNIHARLGEVLYSAAAANDGNGEKQLSDSLRRFCRSIELCDDYLRGYYGLKLTSQRILALPTRASRQTKDDGALSSLDSNTLQSLNLKATSKLAEIVRRSVAGESGWQGYDAAELIAARALLDKDTTSTIR